MHKGFEPELVGFFRARRKQLMAEASAAGSAHSGLAGSHREALIRQYLSAVMPRRLEVGRGMVFGVRHRSREADLVLWDSMNYPSLTLKDHSLFFAESVRVVVEAKSQWSSKEFTDILSKCRAVRDIITVNAPNLSDTISMLELEIQALREGRDHEGLAITKPHIGTAGFVFFGGASLTARSVAPEWLDDADDTWPDVLLLLEPGTVVAKHRGSTERAEGTLEFIHAGEDGLLVFTAILIGLMNERSVLVEDHQYLSLYIQETMSCLEAERVAFKLTRPTAGRTSLWGSDE
jgi:hypothetical protein